MESRYKNYLLITIIATLVVLSFNTIWFVSSYSRAAEPTSYRSFSVSGEGSVTTIPDVAEFSFGIVTQGGIDLTATQEENTKTANNAITLLKELGVEEKDITTSNYNVSPRYQYYNCYQGNTVCPPAEIVGYTVTESINVRVRNFDILGDLLSGVVEKGANTVSQLQFTVDDSTELQNEARKEAIDNAKAKAQALAKAGGFRIGRLLSIQENSVSPPFYYDTMTMEAGKGGAASSPDIQPGSTDVDITVTLRYEIR